MASSGANLEDAYADRSFLLSKLDAQTRATADAHNEWAETLSKLDSALKNIDNYKAAEAWARDDYEKLQSRLSAYRKALEIAQKAMSQPKVYQFHDTDAKAMKEALSE